MDVVHYTIVAIVAVATAWGLWRGCKHALAIEAHIAEDLARLDAIAAGLDAIAAEMLRHSGYEGTTMDDHPVTPQPHPASPEAARAALHAIIDRLTDAEVTAFWRLVCSWVVDASRPPPAAPGAPDARPTAGRPR
jgi:hypothetical protein